ncbi:DUF2079 domain-containing protein [soil metagenome]
MSATASGLVGGEQAAGRAAPRTSGARPSGARRWVPAGLGAVFFAVYVTVSTARYDRLDTISWDLGIFAQAAQSYAARGYPVVDIKAPGFSLLGDHFSPVIALWGPLWALAPSPVTLLVAQAVLIAYSVVPIARVAIGLLGHWAGTAVGVAYGMSFGLLAAIDFDVHEYAFAAPLLALAGEAYLRRRWAASCLWAAALLLVKEDLGLTVAAIGVALALTGARRWGVGLVGLGLAAVALTLLVVIPAFSPGDSWDYWGRLGAGGDDPSSAGIITSLVGLPVNLFTPGVKAGTWLATFGVTGFLALRSPWVIAVLPTMLWRLGSDYEFYWGLNLHYSLVPMPIVFVAMIDAIVRSREGRRAWLAWYAERVPTLALVVALALSTQGPLVDLLSPSSYADTARERDAERVQAMLPAGSSVETDIELLAPLVADHDVYFIGTNDGARSVPVDYVVVDRATAAGWPMPLRQWAQERHPGFRYEQLSDFGGYQVVRRVS